MSHRANEPPRSAPLRDGQALVALGRICVLQVSRRHIRHFFVNIANCVWRVSACPND